MDLINQMDQITRQTGLVPDVRTIETLAYQHHFPQPVKTTTRQVRSWSGLCVAVFMQVAEERK